jgi:hypothetical protein
MRLLPVISLVLATPAVALAPPLPECVMDKDREVLIRSTDQTGSDDFHVNLTMREWPNNVVTFSWQDDSFVERHVVQHCPTKQFLLVVPAPDNDRMIGEVFYRLMQSDQEFTLRQLGEYFVPLGAQVRIGRGEWGDCVCNVFGLEQVQ